MADRAPGKLSAKQTDANGHEYRLQCLSTRDGEPQSESMSF